MGAFKFVGSGGDPVNTLEPLNAKPGIFGGLVVVASWGIAFVEYCLAVPANRYGSAIYSTAQLKTMQEVITLCVFVAFSVLYLNEAVTWRHALGFALIALGAAVVFSARS